MLIGPNDPSTRSHFEDKFITAYTELMAQIADKYAYAEVKPKIISVCGGSINGLDPCPNIQIAIANYNADDDNNFTVSSIRMSKFMIEVFLGGVDIDSRALRGL